MMKADHRNLAVLTILVLLGASLLGTTIGRDSTPSQEMDGGGVATPLADLPGWFTENQGQIADSSVRFTQSQGGVAFLDSSVLLPVGEAENQTWLKITFPGANLVSPMGENLLTHRSNFLVGNNEDNWFSNVRSYQRIVYINLYDGIDLVYYFATEGLKYDWLVQPGADSGIIRERYENAKEVSIDENGDLVISTSIGELKQSKPISYQSDIIIPSYFQLHGKDIIGYTVENYNRLLPLIIDPLIYSTFLGGYLSEEGRDIAVDQAGNVYITGFIDSVGIGTVNDGQRFLTDLPGRNAFVAKLNSNGKSLEFFTYIGGSNIKSDNRGYGITLDDNGFIYITGETDSSDFPTSLNAFDKTYNEHVDVFIVKLSPDGQDIIYSTLIGGNGIDVGKSIAVDKDGSAYVGGYANKDMFKNNDPNSTISFPTTEGAQNISDKYGRADAFILKISSDGSSLIYSTVISSDHIDFVLDITVDFNGNLYATGRTDSFNFPVTINAFDNNYNGELWDYEDYYGGDSDIIVFKLNPNGTELLYSTYIGGKKGDDANGITVDREGNAYIVGSTESPDFPTTPNAYDTSYNYGYDAFVLKLNPNGSDLLYSTYLGGRGLDFGEDITIDDNGTIYLTGFADPGFPITPGAVDDTPNGGGDAFVAVLSENGTRLEYSTFLGGDVIDSGNAITVDQQGFIYITGDTNQHPTYSKKPFPTTKGAFDTSPNGGDDIFVVKLDPTPGGRLVEDEGSIPAPGLLSVLTVMLVVVIIGRRKSVLRWKAPRREGR